MPTAGNTSENTPVQRADGLATQQNLVQQLEHRVAVLESELAASRAKCDEHRQFVLQWVAAQHSPEELEKFAMDDDESKCQPLSQFIGELEAMVCASKNIVFVPSILPYPI